MIKIAKVFMLTCMMSAGLCSAVNAAEQTLVPTPYDNLTVRLKKTSKLVAVEDGFMRVYYNGQKKNINIEYYDTAFKVTEKKSLNLELEYFGGFYAGKDAYYLIEGQSNTEEDDSKEVYRVIRYDKSWEKTGTAKITGDPDLWGGEVRYPFDYGCVEAAEYGDTLYFVTGHEGYADDEYGQGHQGYLMAAVDTKNMTGKLVDGDYWHSFAQYVEVEGDEMYLLEQSEGNYCTQLSRFELPSFEKESIDVLKYGGERTSAWAVACYASVNDLAVGSDYVLGIGTSIDQSKYDVAEEENLPHNIYLTVTPKDNFSEEATEVKWITDRTEENASFLGVNLTEINNDRFLLSWEETVSEETQKPEILGNDLLSENTLHYVFLNGKGDMISKEYTVPATISDCVPIVHNGDIIYYASSNNMLDFYRIDTETGAFSKKTHQVTGPNATWELKDGVLTISGTGIVTQGKEEAYCRYPLSSTNGWYTYSSADNGWAPIHEKVKKIKIDKGITEIEPLALAHFGQAKTIVIENGLKKIGDEAFVGCNNLETITIPESVTSFGEDFIWCGYVNSNDEHICYTYIIAPSRNAPVFEYAKKHNLRCCLDFTKVTVKGLKTAYTCTGDDIWPNIQVYYEDELLEGDSVDYWIELYDNRKIGTATIELNGCGDYYGTVKKTFKIEKQLSQPTDLSVSNGEGTAKISWEAVNDAESYQVYYESGDTWKKLGNPVTKTSYIHKNLTSDTVRTYTVQALNGSKKSSYGLYTIFNCYLDMPVVKVTNGNGYAKLSWASVKGAESYQVYYKSGDTWKKLGNPTTKTSYTHKNLTSGSKKTYAVRAIKDSYRSTYKAVSNYYLDMPVVKVTNGNGYAKLSWASVKGAESYQVYYKSDDTWKKLGDPTTKTSYTHKNLTSGSKKTYAVKAIKGSYRSTYKAVSNYYLDMPVVKVTRKNGTAKISWQEVKGAKSYQVYYKSGDTWKKLGDPITKTSYTHKYKGKAKTYTVRALNGSYKSTYQKP